MAKRLPPRGVQSGDELAIGTVISTLNAQLRDSGASASVTSACRALWMSASNRTGSRSARSATTRCRTPSATRASFRSRSHGVSGL